MVYRTESKLQGWRAVAVFADGTECLVYLGRSTTQVRAGYAAAYAELLDDEEHHSVREVVLECWQGAADVGRWIRKSTLSVPSREPLAAAEDGLRPSGPAFSASGTAAEVVLQSGELSGVLPYPEPSGKTEKGGKRPSPVGVF
jgi:hypothetical protein